MKHLLFLCITFFFILSAQTQNVGIKTTNPQATLDVRGSMRFGGNNNYIRYDSATGKIEWIGASLFTPISQQIISHSASSEGLYAGGGKLEYRNQFGNPVFFSNWINGNGYFSGDLGVGIPTPQHKLHLFNGASGSTAPFGYNQFALESNGNINMSFLTPDANESTIWFSKPSKPLGGGIFYNNPVAPDGFVFLANNAPRMAITNTGKIGIGLNSPATKLHLYDGGSGATPFTFSRLAVESDGHTYINLLSPAANETAILFGKAGNAASGVIMYNNDDNPNGFQFRNNGNLTRMVITNSGNVGIGITNPQHPLDINGRMRLSGNVPFTAGVWLTEAGIEKSFIGLQNNNQVGFYGADGGIGWGLTMNTQTGALKVNGTEGNSGQILASNGSGAAASWSNRPYAFTIIPTLFTSLNGVLLSKDINGVNNTPFTLSQNSTVVYTFTLPVSATGPGTIDSKGYVVIEIVNSASARVSYASSDYYIKRSTSTTQIASGVALNLPAGSYTIKARLVRLAVGDGDVDTHASLNANQQGIQFIAQVLPN